MRKVFEIEMDFTGELIAVLANTPSEAISALRGSSRFHDRYSADEKFKIYSEEDFRSWLFWYLNEPERIENEVSVSERIYARIVKLQYRISSLKRRFVKAIMPPVNDVYFDEGKEDIII